jgi:ATPase involved in DNA replication initiation
MDIKKIYISGKITGLPIDEVVVKFKAAEAKIRRFGYQPVNPLRNGLPREAEWADQMGEDVKLLLKSDAIYLIADWQQSEGATLEYLIARQRRMRIFLAETFAAHAAVETNTEQSHETEA